MISELSFQTKLSFCRNRSFKGLKLRRITNPTKRSQQQMKIVNQTFKVQQLFSHFISFSCKVRSEKTANFILLIFLLSFSDFRQLE